MRVEHSWLYPSRQKSFIWSSITCFLIYLPSSFESITFWSFLSPVLSDYFLHTSAHWMCLGAVKGRGEAVRCFVTLCENKHTYIRVFVYFPQDRLFALEEESVTSGRGRSPYDPNSPCTSALTGKSCSTHHSTPQRVNVLRPVNAAILWFI